MKITLKTIETMKLFGSTKKLIVLVQCQQKSEVLYTFTPKKSDAYMLNVKLGNLVFLKTYNTA